MNPYFRILWVALIALFPLAGCSPGRDLPELAPKPDVSYHLGPGDILGIKVLGADELNGQYTVQDDGTIRMLLVGAVPAAASGVMTTGRDWYATSTSSAASSAWACVSATTRAIN